ncbi:MAG: MraY family glycosyltransferase [Bacteroidales bacterium]|jgi:UDP-GlcNAc:undecaprenyl-phosphate GlcNAc-1-phosphate transferase
MNYILITIFLISFLAAVLIDRFFIKRPIKFLVKKANNSAIRFSTQSKPIFGGISFYSIFLLLMIVYFVLYNEEVFVSSEYISILIIVTLSFFMGLADDLINTSPFFKLIVQLICSVIFIYSGVYIKISPVEWINYAITIFWVVGIMNSINMLDNMDAVTSLVSLSIISGVIFGNIFFDVSISNLGKFILLGTAASLLAFLFFNWNPSKMYMGDNGSQYLGIILAWVGIVFFWNSIKIEEVQYALNFKQALIVALAYIIPLTDTTTVSINRMLKGKSPFVGGRDHTTHHLFYLGLSVRWVGFLLFLLNTIGVIVALYLITNSNSIDYNNLWYFMIFPVITFLLLYINTHISKPK